MIEEKLNNEIQIKNDSKKTFPMKIKDNSNFQLHSYNLNY